MLEVPKPDSESHPVSEAPEASQMARKKIEQIDRDNSKRYLDPSRQPSSAVELDSIKADTGDDEQLNEQKKRTRKAYALGAFAALAMGLSNYMFADISKSMGVKAIYFQAPSYLLFGIIYQAY
jgi:hypothetical protein